MMPRLTKSLVVITVFGLLGWALITPFQVYPAYAKPPQDPPCWLVGDCDPIPDINDIKGEIQNTGETIATEVENCFSGGCDPILIVSNFDASVEAWGELGRILYPAAAATMATRHAGKTEYALSGKQKRLLRPFLGDVVDRVTVIYNARLMDYLGSFNGETIHYEDGSEAQTYGYRIYVDAAYAPNDIEQTILLGHELVHSLQYERYGNSLGDFGYNYFKGRKQGGNDYDNIPQEVEAKAKETELENKYLGFFVSNLTPSPLWFVVGYFNKSTSTWVSEGWWEVGPEESRQVLQGGLGNRHYYYYAVDESGNAWGGDYYFWIHPSDAFEIPENTSSDIAQSRGYETRGFGEIQTSQRRYDLHLGTVSTALDNNGALVQGSGPELYLIENGQRRLIISEGVFQANGFKWNSVLHVSDQELERVSLGSNITYPAGTQINFLPFQNGLITAFSRGGINFSPDGYNLDGYNLDGDENTKRVYDGTQTVVKMILYQNGLITAFSGRGIYFSPDGNDLGGGGNTIKVYERKTQTVVEMIPYQNGVITAFDGQGIYFSPDGYNLGGGGNTIKVYDGNQTVVKMMPYRDGVITAFSGGGIYFSPDGYNPGGGGNTIKVYDGSQTVVEMIPYQNGLITAFDGRAIYFSPDGNNLGGGGNTIKVYDGNQAVVEMIPYQYGVITAFDGRAIYFSPDGNNLGGGGNTIRVYDGSQTLVDMAQYKSGVVSAFSGGSIYFSPDGTNVGGGGNTVRVYPQ